MAPLGTAADLVDHKVHKLLRGAPYVSMGRGWEPLAGVPVGRVTLSGIIDHHLARQVPCPSYGELVYSGGQFDRPISRE